MKSVMIGCVCVTIAQVRDEERRVAALRAKGKDARVRGLYAAARDLMGPDPAPKAAPPQRTPSARPVLRAPQGDSRGAVPVGMGLSRVSGKDKRADKIARDRRRTDV